jgi:hypothetical protein
VTLLYGLSRATSDLDVLLIAPREQRAALLELGVRGGVLHRKYKIYLDYVTVARVPEDYEGRLTEMFPGATSASGSAPSVLTTAPYQSSSVTFSGTAMM